MLLKTVVIVLKRRDGPASTAIPNDAHAGKIIKPAVTATKVSRIMTFTDSPIRLLSFPM